MGQLDEQSENLRGSDSQAAAALVRAMTQDIENLRQTLLVQLSQDVERLQREKSQLIEEIEKLQAQRQQQIVQQQKLIRQIAPTLTNQLQELLTQRLNQLAESLPVNNLAGSGLSPTSNANDYNENAYRLIASLDSTLRATLTTLQQDLSSYQISLSQQLGQMYSLEQQGEEILEALVNRLRKEIQSESPSRESSTAPPFPRPKVPEEPTNHHHSSKISSPREPSVPEVERVPSRESIGTQKNSSLTSPPHAIPVRQQRWKVLIGFLLVLISSLVLSFQNVLITVIFNKSPIFDEFELGGFIAPTGGNSLLLLWLRMLFVVPLMAILATVLYPGMWRDLRQFAQSKDLLSFLRVLSSGFFLFLSQVLIYFALGSIPPSVAITIFFIYPIFTLLLTGVLFSDRTVRRPTSFSPNLPRRLIVFSMLIGFVLIALPISNTTDLSGMGVIAAVCSSLAFACHIILGQPCSKKLNPIPLTWINLVLILVFSSISLAGPFPEVWRFQVAPSMWPNLMISSLVLGSISLVIYLLDNISMRMISAAKASILGATVPALTAFLALGLIKSTLLTEQIFGLVLVSLGVAALRFELWSGKTQTTQSAVRKIK